MSRIELHRDSVSCPTADSFTSALHARLSIQALKFTDHDRSHYFLSVDHAPV